MSSLRLFHVHLSQPLQSGQWSGGSHVAWRPGPVLSPVFQIMDCHNCHIKYRPAGVAATSQFSSRGLTHAHHLGKEPRRSVRRSPGALRCPPARKPGSRARDIARVIARNSRKTRGRRRDHRWRARVRPALATDTGGCRQKYAASNFHNLSQNLGL